LGCIRDRSKRRNHSPESFFALTIVNLEGILPELAVRLSRAPVLK